MATHSSTLAWRVPWVEEPGGLQSMGSLRVRHDWATSLSLFIFMRWRRKWQPTSSVLAWRIPGTGKSGGLPSMGLHRVGHNWSDLAAAAADRVRPDSISPTMSGIDSHSESRHMTTAVLESDISGHVLVAGWKQCLRVMRPVPGISTGNAGPRAVPTTLYSVSPYHR